MKLRNQLENRSITITAHVLRAAIFPRMRDCPGKVVTDTAMFVRKRQTKDTSHAKFYSQHRKRMDECREQTIKGAGRPPHAYAGDRCKTEAHSGRHIFAGSAGRH
jgi:hypothetical protein